MNEATADATADEEWRAIPGYPDYEVSSIGRVRRLTSRTAGRAGHIMRAGAYGDTGHVTVQLWTAGKAKVVTVSRLIALAFHGLPPSLSHLAAHNDGRPWNNVPANIRWATATENMADKLLHGTARIGERHPRVVLTEDKVRMIRRQSVEGSSLKTLGRMHGVHFGTIWRVVKRLTWQQVE